jgi:hypothetical protein
VSLPPESKRPPWQVQALWLLMPRLELLGTSVVMGVAMGSRFGMEAGLCAGAVPVCFLFLGEMICACIDGLREK